MTPAGKNAAAARRTDAGAKSRREQLLDQAARELNSKGISMTSLTDVADKLGFSRASLYYYVEDREDLMFQVYLRSSEIMARRLGEAAQSADSVLQVVGNFISLTLDPAEPELAALSEIGLLDQAARETVLGIFEAVVARLASLLESGAKAGSIRICDCRANHHQHHSLNTAEFALGNRAARESKRNHCRGQGHTCRWLGRRPNQ